MYIAPRTPREARGDVPRATRAAPGIDLAVPSSSGRGLDVPPVVRSLRCCRGRLPSRGVRGEVGSELMGPEIWPAKRLSARVEVGEVVRGLSGRSAPRSGRPAPPPVDLDGRPRKAAGRPGASVERRLGDQTSSRSVESVPGLDVGSVRSSPYRRRGTRHLDLLCLTWRSTSPQLRVT